MPVKETPSFALPSDRLSRLLRQERLLCLLKTAPGPFKRRHAEGITIFEMRPREPRKFMHLRNILSVVKACVLSGNMQFFV